MERSVYLCYNVVEWLKVFQMWLRRIFSIGKNDLSSRTFHRNIEYDKIISRHPSRPSANGLSPIAHRERTIPVLW